MQELFTRPVKSLQDARDLVDSAAEGFHSNRNLDLPAVESIKRRVADAEYAFALVSRNKRTSFPVICSSAGAFICSSRAIRPDVVPRHENRISVTCRPIEAMYVLFLLDFNAGISSTMKRSALWGDFPSSRRHRTSPSCSSTQPQLDIHPPGSDKALEESRARKTRYSYYREIFVRSLTPAHELDLLSQLLEILRL